MKKSCQKLSLLLTFVMALSLFVTPAAALEGQKPAGVDTLLQMSGATSIQYALIQGDEITLSGQAGSYSKTENRALTAENLYGVGSVSKVYTAAAVMKLVENGKVSLDTPLTAYLPEFKMADDRYKSITVRMLLNHSSGLRGSTLNNGFLFSDNGTYAKDALLKSLETQTLKADPGAYSVYCNDGFILAELLIERVSGKSYTAFVRESLLSPLGLTHTFTPEDSFDRSLLAKTYYGTIPTALPTETTSIIGTGGVYTSAEDLARFGSAFYSDKVLSQGSRSAMAAEEYKNGFWPAADLNTLSYGLGWDNVELFPFDRAGIQVLVKGGDTLNYHATLLVIPEYKMAVAVLSSGGVSTYNQMLGAQILIDALAEKGITVDGTVPPFPASAAAPIPESELAKAGRYTSTLRTLDINLSPEGEMTIAGIDGMVLTYREDGSYRNAAETVLFKLVEEKNGKVYLYEQAYTQVPGLAPLAASDYAAQRVEKNAVSDEAWAQWEALGSQFFFIINEVPSSQIYLLQAITALPVTRNEYGYFGGFRILDKNTMAPDVNIPGAGSRDYQTIRTEQKDGATYLHMNNYLAIGADNVPAVYAGVDAICTIQKDGYARWYKVGAAAGKEMSVKQPAGSNFYVYDQSGVVVASSIFGDNNAVLPEGGYMVFLGTVGSQFKITIS